MAIQLPVACKVDIHNCSSCQKHFLLSGCCVTSGQSVDALASMLQRGLPAGACCCHMWLCLPDHGCAASLSMYRILFALLLLACRELSWAAVSPSPVCIAVHGL